jgi:hypothetical protein
MLLETKCNDRICSNFTVVTLNGILVFMRRSFSFGLNTLS